LVLSIAPQQVFDSARLRQLVGSCPGALANVSHSETSRRGRLAAVLACSCVWFSNATPRARIRVTTSGQAPLIEAEKSSRTTGATSQIL
jgi:hypothetical protein